MSQTKNIYHDDIRLSRPINEQTGNYEPPTDMQEIAAERRRREQKERDDALAELLEPDPEESFGEAYEIGYYGTD